jgi:hypothetical protein
MNLQALERYSVRREAFHFADRVPQWAIVMRKQLKKLRALSF